MSHSDSLAPPDLPTDARLDQAMSRQIAGRLEEAERMYVQILEQQPHHAIANHCLGMLYVHCKRPADGLAFLLRALEGAPEESAYWLGYLDALLLAGRIEEASTAFNLARQHGLQGPAAEGFAARLSAATGDTKLSRADRRREDREARENEEAVQVLVKHGRFADALMQARGLTERFPERGLGWKILGALLWSQGQMAEALSAMRLAAQKMPQDAEVRCNLGVALIKLEHFTDAENYLREALEIDDASVIAHSQLGNLYQLQGRYAEAEASSRKSLALQPDRVLRVGMVSGDLCNHAVAHFIEPVLAELQSHPMLQLHAYYNNTIEDAVTARMRGYFAQWHGTAALSNARLAAKIMDDQIDVLIDLSGHTSMNRLQALARKPAPVQASWIGYPGTTGLRAMDYYLADPHFLPPGKFDSQFTENLVYLPANVPFKPHPDSPPVNSLPAMKTGAMTFGSFNRLGKINTASIELWSQLLNALPEARLIIGGLQRDQEHLLIERFNSANIASTRLTFLLRDSIETYLAHHHQVDLCVDTIPYSGGTTTFHALWMGVPTLTLGGSTPAARQGAAIMGQLNLDAFVASDAGDFVRKGRYWAADLDELAAIRAGLRARWEASSARDPKVVAAGLDAAIRRMWKRWCARLAPESFEIRAEEVRV